MNPSDDAEPDDAIPSPAPLSADAFPSQAWIAAFDRAAEGTASAEEVAAIEALVLANPAAAREYTKCAHERAALVWWARVGGGAEPPRLPFGKITAMLAGESSGEASGQGPVPATDENGGALPVHTPKTAMGREWLQRGEWRWWAAAAAVLAALGLGVVWSDGPRTFATLVEARHCRWESTDLPTSVGSRLSKGDLVLAEGVVRLRFDHGAELTLEGPARLRLESLDRCVLSEGRVMGRVPPAAVGFVVDTPTAVVKDLGTEFGVLVRKGESAEVQVFAGLVDVQHRGTGDVERLEAGRNVRFLAGRREEVDPNAVPMDRLRAPAHPDQAERLQISTASGRGKDGYVQVRFPTENISDTLILVKNSVSLKRDFLRKGYFAIDLAPVAGRGIVQAELTVAYEPTGMGFGGEVPDATFTLYGLTDQTQDDWGEKSIRWETAPANRDGAAEVDPEKTVKLGTFVIPQGISRGTASIDGPALREFLATDENGLATFILVRETPGSGKNDMVHGFVGREHASGAPPTLKLFVQRNP